MKPLLTLIAIALFCSAVPVQAQKPIKPAKTYKQNGMTVASPNQPGWIKLETGKTETAFEKRTESDVLNANIKTVPTKIYKTDQDRLADWEALKNEELSKYTQDHLHFNYIKFKGAMSLHYDAFFPLEKTPTNNFAYLNVRGYLIPLPNTKDTAVQIEFSDYSNNKGFTKDLQTLADQFFEKLTLPKQK